MSGIAITITVRDEPALAPLRAMLARFDRREPFFKGVAGQLMSSTSDRFRSQTDPQGRPWTPLAASTIRNRTRKGQVPLTILRSNSRGMAGSPLAGSIHASATNDEARIGSVKAYAAIHQLGGTIDKPAGTRWMAGRRFAKKATSPEGREVAIPAHRISIPARPFLGLSAADEAAILDQAERWLRG